MHGTNARRRRLTKSASGWLRILLVVLLASPALGHAAQPPATTAAANYPAQRDRLRAEIDHLDKEPQLAAMERLRALADANGDRDLAQLMQVERIFALHDDGAIDKSLAELNAVRSQVRPHASVELQETLERVYGNLYFDAGNFALALQHQLASLELTARLPRDAESARLYRLSTIAELYNAMGTPTKALQYADEGLPLTEGQARYTGSRISLLGARGQALMHLGDMQAASAALDAAERIDAASPPGFNTLRLADKRATLQLAMAQPQQALRTIETMQALATPRDNHYYLTRARLLRGQARIVAGNVDAGLVEMRAAIGEFQSMGQMIDVLDGLEREVRTLQAKQAWPETVEVMQRRHVLWSELFQSAQSRGIAELEARHRAEARERQITALASEVELERARLRSERLWMALVATMAVLAICLAGLLYLSRRRTRQERDRLSHAARHDPLTGAYSRYEFQRRHVGPMTALRGTTPCIVLLLDLDEFKAINDQYGHEAGDAILKSVVARLGKLMIDGDDLYRWGCEEFLLVLADRGEDALERQISALLDAVTLQPHQWNGQAIPMTVSGGLVRQDQVSSADEAPLGNAIRWADAALYAAKNAGRNRVVKAWLTPEGSTQLHGRRPMDVAQLLDWERSGLVVLQTLLPTRNNANS